MSKTKIQKLVTALETLQNVNDKNLVAKKISNQFSLTRDRSVYFCKDFALRFSSSSSQNFSNTVLSLSALRKYDHIPFIVVLILPNKIVCLLANTTLLNKISHSSQQLTETNIKGSFNGSDILREISDIENTSKNLSELFQIHNSIGFEQNLPRLVKNTHDIVPTGSAFVPNKRQLETIMSAPLRSQNFLESKEYKNLKVYLDNRIKELEQYLIQATHIDNVNVRGRVIEYLISGNDKHIVDQIIDTLQGRRSGFPNFKTDNSLADHISEYESYLVATDIKSKMLTLNSNPKGYNLDKMLDFLCEEKSVLMFYFVGIGESSVTNTGLVSVFEERLLSSTILLRHWAGRNSRGAAQFTGSVIHEVIQDPKNEINLASSRAFLEKVVTLSN